jgi:hypothetical protein
MGSHLATYLRDHHAGATAGVELARRAAGSNEGNPYGEELSRIADEIAEDRASLERVMDELGVRADPIKDRAAWAAEKLGRLKPNGRMIGYSPLSRVIELEGLVLGVTGKLALWESLKAAAGARIDAVDLDRLTERAADQRRRLEALRRDAASEALARE